MTRRDGKEAARAAPATRLGASGQRTGALAGVQTPAQLNLTTPAVSLQVQKSPVPMPTGAQLGPVPETGGQRHAHDVGVDAHAAGVGKQDCPVCPAVPGV